MAKFAGDLLGDLDSLTAPTGEALGQHFGPVQSSRHDLFAGASSGGRSPMLDNLLAGVGTGARPDLFGGATLGGSADLFGDAHLGGAADLWGGVSLGGGPAPAAGGGLLGGLFSGLGTAARNLWDGITNFGNKPATTTTPAGTPGSTAGATYTGLPADVAKWADQTNSTFGDLGGWVPAAMLAIIQHESEGNPGAYNGAAAGGAWGLFQQMSLGSADPNTQFAAAKQLAQEKLAKIQESYAANGLSPDERTRARDLFLAWAGHFDYGSGQPNQASRDKGSNEDWNAFLNGPRGIMPMYDNIVNGRRQPGAGNVPISAEGFAFPVVGYSQPVQLHWGSEEGGTDIMAAEGTPIVSMGAGTITDVSPNSLGGNTITMKLDNGLIVYMAHLRDAPLVAAGQRVAAGDPLGYVGQTGNAAGTGAHLHIGIGYDIQSGGGPTGGLGTGFNAVDWLNQILRQTGNAGGGGGNLTP